jgi:hypothetical protein
MRSIWTAVSAAAALLFFASESFGQVDPNITQDRKVVEFTRISSGGGGFPFRGVIQCMGAGNPAPADQDTPPWCPAGTRTVVTNRILTGKWVMSDASVSGNMTWFMNFNVDSATFTGPWWGEFMLDVPGKGTWQGWFWGESSGAYMAYRAIGIGTDGLDKCTIMIEMAYPDTTSKPPVIKGRFLQPPAQ